MRNKGAVIGLAVIITVLSVYQLYFTFKSSSIDKEVAADVATQVEKLKSQNPTWEKDQLDSAQKSLTVLYIDSIRDLKFGWEGSTYDEIKEKELNLGLDLQGGIHITLVVSPEEIMKAMAGRNQSNPDFIKAMDQARKMQSSSQLKFTQLFYGAFVELKGGEAGKLNQLFLTKANANVVTTKTTDEEIIALIDTELDEAIDRSIIVLRSRIDKFGASQPIIQPNKATGRIEIELPGVNDKDRVKRNVQAVAELEFRDLYEPQRAYEVWKKVMIQLEKFERARTGTEGEEPSEIKEEGSDNLYEEETISATDSDGIDEEPSEEEVTEEESSVDEDVLFASDEGDTTKGDSTAQVDEKQDAVTDLLSEYLTLADQRGYIYRSNFKYFNRLNAYFNTPEIKAIMPADMTFMWGNIDENEEDPEKRKYVDVYFVKKGVGVEPILTGDVVENAGIRMDEMQGQWLVTMSFNPEGTKKWARVTKEYAEAGNKPVAIVLDDRVFSAPSVQTQIPNGQSSISGNFDKPEGAMDLANILKAGRLPAPLLIEQMIEVGPSLGQKAIDRGLLSLLAGLALVVLFMVLYYSKGGLVADIALLFNIFFILGILSTPSIGAALTLPGIAGIVLTIGMSIDANVLIFERIREELKAGKGMHIAIKNGYDKAFWTIFDANVTTLLTAIILYSMGSGLVKGFAVTLMIGIACSFFSAVFITRLIVEFMTKGKEDKAKISFESGLSKNLFQNLSFNFIGKRKIAYALSIGLITAGIVVMLTNGLNLGVAFKGGHSYIVHFDKDVSPTDIKASLKGVFGDASTEVKSFDGNDQVAITTSYLIEEQSPETDDKIKDAMMAGLAQYKELNPTILQTIVVGPTIADDIKQTSIQSIVVALICIFVYIIVRFRRWQFGMGALFALFHDVLVVLSVFAICGLFGLVFEIDEVFIAAVLTIVGYSINDTVVVFDRVREYMKESPTANLADTLNRSLNSTLSRTLMTSITTLLVIVVLLIWGGEALRGFSFALLIGVLVGTYSSIFVATPVVLDATAGGKRLKAEKPEESKKEEAVTA